MTERNAKIIRQLKKMKSVDLNDPIARAYLVNNLSAGWRNREAVATAVASYAANHKDAVINSRKEREMLAVLITRRANRMTERVPLSRAFGTATTMMKRRRYNFTESRGRGIRKFDGWRGFRVADANTKFDAQRLAKFIRKGYYENKVRIIPYQAGRKTHYSVYSANPVTVAHKSYVDGLRRHKGDAHVDAILARVVDGNHINPLKRKVSRIQRVPSPGGAPILLTKKRIPELGLRMRVH